MRITIKMTKDDARSLSRFLAVYSEEITEAWFVKRVVEDDYLRLERVLRGVRGERGRGRGPRHREQPHLL